MYKQIQNNRLLELTTHPNEHLPHKRRRKRHLPSDEAACSIMYKLPRGLFFCLPPRNGVQCLNRAARWTRLAFFSF
jgi:hypothetical protein